jgi:tetratricopeptide (TPR) repeat protein
MTESLREALPASYPEVGRLPSRAIAVAGAALVPIAVGAASGGYFPSAWGWISLVALWVAALALLLDAPQLGRRDTVFLALLALFVAWVGLSALWSSATPALRELERDLAYLAVALAALVLVRRTTVVLILGGLASGIALLSVYSLGTRLFPNRIGSYDPVAVYRLSAPIGYWNTLGILAAIGIVLGFGFLARTPSAAVRAAACAGLVVLSTTLYFTYSRGALLALGLALVALFAVDRARLQAAVAMLAGAPAAALAVFFASREHALTQQHAPLREAVSAGQRLAVILLVLLVVAAALGLLLDLLSKRFVPPKALRTVFASVLTAGVAAVCFMGIVAYGSPVHAVSRAWHDFSAAPPKSQTNLNSRLFSFSGNGRADLYRLSWRDFKAHPLLGTGAGSFEQRWLSGRPAALKVRDAHSLYIEVLGELGLIGLALIVLALAVPLLAVRRIRRHPYAPFALAAYVALVVHAGVDWDWEMPVLMISGLLIAASLLAWARAEDAPPIGGRTRGALLAAIGVAMVFALITLVGNMSLAQASTAADNGSWAASARDAKRAHTWAPWSSEPYRLLGEAQLGEGDSKSAVASFDKAIAKSPDDWNLWFDLARATTDTAQRQALDHAARLNPLSPEIAELRREIAAEKVINVRP